MLYEIEDAVIPSAEQHTEPGPGFFFKHMPLQQLPNTHLG